MTATESMCCCWNLSCSSCHDLSCDSSPSRDYHSRCSAHPPADHSDDDGGDDDVHDVYCYYAEPYSLVGRQPMSLKRSVDNLYR